MSMTPHGIIENLPKVMSLGVYGVYVERAGRVAHAIIGPSVLFDFQKPLLGLPVAQLLPAVARMLNENTYPLPSPLCSVLIRAPSSGSETPAEYLFTLHRTLPVKDGSIEPGPPLPNEDRDGRLNCVLSMNVLPDPARPWKRFGVPLAVFTKFWADDQGIPDFSWGFLSNSPEVRKFGPVITDYVITCLTVPFYLSPANCKIVERPEPTKLNKIRTAKGKPAINRAFSIYLQPEHERELREHQGDPQASPTPHMRLGHLRTLHRGALIERQIIVRESGITWSPGIDTQSKD
jgi:hypothetical protein